MLTRHMRVHLVQLVIAIVCCAAVAAAYITLTRPVTTDIVSVKLEKAALAAGSTVGVLLQQLGGTAQLFGRLYETYRSMSSQQPSSL